MDGEKRGIPGCHLAILEAVKTFLPIYTNMLSNDMGALPKPSNSERITLLQWFLQEWSGIILYLQNIPANMAIWHSKQILCYYVSIPSFCNTSQWFPSPQSFLCFLFSIISHPPIGRFNTRFGTTELQGDAAKHGGPQQSCYLNETAGQQILVDLTHLKQKIQ